MCYKKKCLKCGNYFHKDIMYYHKHYDKYYKTYWCQNCLRKHYKEKIGNQYTFELSI